MTMTHFNDVHSHTLHGNWQCALSFSKESSPHLPFDEIGGVLYEAIERDKRSKGE